MSTAKNLATRDLIAEQASEIMVLDDCEFDRKRLRRALLQLPLPLNVTEVDDLAGLAQQVTSKRFDLILVDYALAQGNGMQALEQIKSSGLNADCVVVMVTGNDCAKLAVNALRSGFDDYLTKDQVDPIILGQVLATVDRKPNTNVVQFPQGNRAFAGKEMLNLPPLDLSTMLEPAMQAALAQAVAQARMENLGDDLFTQETGFHDDD